MSQKFQATVHQRGDVSFVKLAGVVDEDNELTDLVDKIGKGTCVIDLGEVERINSCGVRDWVNWLGKIEKHESEVVLVECSPAIVAQINLVNNFTGAGVVKSFYVPYFCPECDEEKVLLCDTGEMGPPPHEPPTCRCDECDLVMDFDDMPDSYFAFLTNQAKVAEPSKVQAVLNEFNPSDGEKSKIRSRVGSTSLSGASLSSSLPSVPSLPSISRSGLGGTGTGTRPGGTGTGAGPGGTGTGSRPSGISGPQIVTGSGADEIVNPAAARAALESPKSGMLVYVLVAVLLLAIAVLGVLLFANE